MLGTKTAQRDWLALDRHQSNGFVSRSHFEDITDTFYKQRSSTLSLTRSSSILTPTRSNSALPDSSQLATASNVSAFRVNTQQIAGTLRADNFTVSSSVARTIVSGNGNVDFGNGERDLLDLSSISYSSVSFNWATQSGIVYNPGNGNRIFDAINFNDGRQILFEGIDSIRFSDGVINLSITPNDPLFNQQWNLHMMGVQNAWRFTTGATNVAIGVEDTGLSINNAGKIHSDLRSTKVNGNQFIDDTRDNHGTAVQGIIAASTNNATGMSGINWKSTVMNADVLGGNPGDLSLASASQQIIDQARQNGQRLVINLSLGIPDSFGVNYNTGLEQVVRDNPNVLFVIAAGNSGNVGIEGISSPATLARSYSNVIAVGAVWGAQDYFGRETTPGTRIDYPSWWGSQYGAGLTLVAPSEVIAPNSVVTADGSVQFTYQSDFNGTSAATPNATGVASLILSANPLLSAAQVRQIMTQTAVDVGQTGYDKFTGAGMVNADAAVRRAIAISRGFA